MSLRQFLEPSEKSFTQTIRWNLVNLVNIYHGNYRTSTHHRSETNGIAERGVRIKEGTSAVLLQSGLDEQCVICEMSKTSWQMEKHFMDRFGESFEGPNHSVRSNG